MPKPAMASDEELMERAVKRYARECASVGAIYQQPSSATSTASRTRVVLRNVRGVLAVYAIKSGRLYRTE